jgi:putative hydrolase of the HAD superfamily
MVNLHEIGREPVTGFRQWTAHAITSPMTDRPFDLIAFDGDDTLWHNERSYRDGRERFRRLLAAAGVDMTEEEIEAQVNETEVANIRFYGYGVSSFILSLIETAIRLTSGRVAGADLHDLIDLAKQMLAEEVELFPWARETVTALAARYPLMLITKGDLLHQTSKLDRSGLRPYFTSVEVVSHKTPEVYAALLSRHRIDPARFLMVGNSLRSDVLPVIELGARAVYVPAELTWAHEHADVPASAQGRLVELAGLDGLAGFVEMLENPASAPPS